MGKRSRQRRRAEGRPAIESGDERYRRVYQERDAFWTQVFEDEISVLPEYVPPPPSVRKPGRARPRRSNGGA